MPLAARTPSSGRQSFLEQLRLRLMSESNCGLQAERFSPSGSDAADMWDHGLGSTQTTPSTSTQAVPAPRLVRREQAGSTGGEVAFYRCAQGTGPQACPGSNIRCKEQ